MTTLWFRTRTYGWGWTPATAEGWLVFAVFVAGVIVNVVIFEYRKRGGGDARSATISFLVWLAVLVAALVTICWATGERPRWHWGD